MKNRPPAEALVLTGCFAVILLSMSVLLLRPPVNVSSGNSVRTYYHHGVGYEEKLPMENWDDPVVIREQQVQMFGMLIFFAGVGAVSKMRQAKLRRFYHA